MSTTGVTKSGRVTKHILTMAALTVAFGVGSAWLLPGYISAAGLNPATVVAIFLGAMSAALVTAKVKIENLIATGLVGATVTTVITSVLYGAFGLGFDAVVGVVFGGAFIATIVAKRWHK